jgi:hypothetical protein
MSISEVGEIYADDGAGQVVAAIIQPVIAKSMWMMAFTGR